MIEQCSYCGETHEIDEIQFYDVSIKTCPRHPVNYPQMTFIGDGDGSLPIYDSMGTGKKRDINQKDDSVDTFQSDGLTVNVSVK